MKAHCFHCGLSIIKPAQYDPYLCRFCENTAPDAEDVSWLDEVN